MITDLNKIIAEWSYRTRDGKPDVNNNAKLILLEGVLTEFGWSREAKAELLNSLLKEDDIVTKIGGSGSPYTVKSYNKEKHNLITKDASEDEIEKAKKGGGETKPTSEKVIDDLTTDDGKALNDRQKASIKDNQKVTLDYLRSPIDDEGREKGMKGKKISEETHKAHLRAADTLEDIWAGKEVSDEDKEHLSNWVAVVEPSQGKPNMWRIYIAREPGKDGKGNFNRLRGMPADKLGGKNGFGDNQQGKAMQSWMQANGIRTVRTSTYAGKLTTPNQIFSKGGKVKKIKQIPKENVSRNNDGKVKSVKLSEGLTLTRVPKKDNETDRERKKRKQNNAQIDEYGSLIEKGELEFIDMDSGVNPDSAENRKQIIQEGLLGVSKKLELLGRRPIAGVPEGPNNPPPVDAAADDIINRIKDLSEKDPNENPKEWKEELDKAMVDLAEHEQLGKSFANIAELYSAIKTMHGDGEGTEAGAAAFLPESTTLETVDVLVVNQSGEGKNKIVTIDGLSVKKGDGGASQLTAKVRKSGFKKLGNLTSEEVKEKTIALSKKHEGIYDNDDVFNESPPSKESIQKETEHQEKTQNEIKESAKELGVDSEYIDYIEKKMNDRKSGKPSQIESAVAGIMKIRKEQGLPVGPEIEAMMTKRMQSYYLYQAMSHRAYNRNLEVQYFGNDSFSIKKGKINISESDGVDKIAWPRFEFNLGFSATGRSANAGGGRFQNSEFDEPAFKKWAPA
jgi:hypothetical protein